MRPRELEHHLRELLTHVELVCDAQISDDLVDLAESEVRPVCNDHRIETTARTSPATLATYFVIRGAERYERNRVWEGLGVVHTTNRAGQAFLDALERLGLPTFADEVEDAGARRFVAPMLMHGAFPAAVAPQLVERIEQELRRGLVDASEAHRRLVNDPNLEFDLRRPAARLLRWAPDYAIRLLDAIIDHIENPGGRAIESLPVHIQNALKENAARRKGLRRLRAPFVEFNWWLGYGPEIVAPESSEVWRIRKGSDSFLLGPDSRVELGPDDAASAHAMGRSIELWHAETVWFFDADGRPTERATDGEIVILRPYNSGVLLDGEHVVPVEEGTSLSGAWSRFRVDLYDIRSGGTLTVENGADDVRSFRAANDQRVTLDTPPVVDVNAADGSTVLNEPPVFSAPGHGSPLHIQVRDHAGGRRFQMIQKEDDGTYSTAELFENEPWAGTVAVRASGPRQEFPLVVAPGLRVDAPDRPLGPDDEATVTVSASPGVLDGDTVMSATEGAMSIPIPITGLPFGTVSAMVPRVVWGLRSAEPGRLTLEPGLITTESDHLIDQDPWLIVRTGRPAQVGFQLFADGTLVQTGASRATSERRGAGHSIGIHLAAIRDTLRAHRDAAIQLNIIADSVSLPAIRCGDHERDAGESGAAPREWATPRPNDVPPEPDESLWSSVPWMGERRTSGDSRAPLPHGMHSFELKLRLAGETYAVPLFLRTFGERARTWRRSEIPDGPSGKEWEAFNQVADELWHLGGRRRRTFGLGPLEQTFSKWARAQREQVRRADISERESMELWLRGRQPPLERLSSWTLRPWVERALPPQASVGVQWFPATLLYHCIAVLTGEHDSEPAVAEAATLRPAMLLDTVAFIMQGIVAGLPLERPTLDVSWEGPDEDEDEDDKQRETVPTVASVDPPLPLPLLTECKVSATPDRLFISAPSGTQAPVVRISADGTALLTRPASTDADGYAVDLPPDLDGDVDLQIVAGSEISNRPAGVVSTVIPPCRAPESAETVAHDLSDLPAAQAAVHVVAIVRSVNDSMLPIEQIEELFEDEHAAAKALVRIADSWPTEVMDRAAIVIAPTALLFSTPLIDDAELVACRSTSEVMYAALAPRNAGSWRELGWPSNVALSPTRPAADAFVGWARKRGRASEPIEGPTWRYQNASTFDNHEILHRVIHSLDKESVDQRFVDLVVATHRMITRERLYPEAARMLLDAHHRQPEAVGNAIIVGLALHQITRN